MAEAVNPREKRAATAVMYAAAWPLCWLLLYILVTAGVIDATKIHAWLTDKLAFRFLRDAYQQTILAWAWMPVASALLAFPLAVKLAPRVVARYGHLDFLVLPAGYSDIEERSWRRRFARRRSDSHGNAVGYRFSSRALPFLGRGQQLRALNEFLAKPEKLRWWWMTGGAGSGKSRMALEWVLSLQGGAGGLFSGTDAGFLSRSAGGPSWPQWEPRRPTVIVIDDANSRAEDVTRILRAFAERQTAFRFRVRVLLVDREVHENLRTLDSDGICGADRHAPPLALEGIPDCLDELARAIATKHRRHLALTPEGRADIVQLSGGRPLFMAWALDSIARGGRLAWSDWQGLLRSQVERLENELKQVTLSPACLPLLALATLTSGLSWTAAQQFRPGVSDEDRRRLIRRGEADSDMVFAVQPEILGEYFLLEQCAYLVPDERERFLATAWNVDTAKTGRTLYGLHCDFADHPQLAVVDQMPSEPGAAHEWGMVRVSLLAKEEDDARRQRYRQDLLDLANRGAACLALPLACDAFNRMIDGGRRQNWPELTADWDDLQQIAARFPDDVAMQLRCASGAVNAVALFGEARKWADAAQALSTLKAIAGRFPDSAKMQLELAMGNRNVVLKFGAGALWDQTTSAWSELQETAQHFPEEVEIHMELAKAAIDLIYYYGEAKRYEDFDDAWQVLVRTTATRPSDPKMQQLLVMGAVGRLSRGRHPDHLASSWRLLLDLSARMPESLLVQRPFAFAAANAIVVFGRVGDTSRVAAASEQLQRLWKAYPTDRELQLSVARGTANEMQRLHDAGPSSQFEEAWWRLRSIAAAFAMDVEINVEVARGAYYAYVCYLRLGYTKSRKNAWDWLEAVNRRFPGHRDIVPLLENAPFSPYKWE